MTVCAVKSSSHRIVETRCGQTTTMRTATIWASDVTCRDCIAGTIATDEYAASIEALLQTGEPT